MIRPSPLPIACALLASLAAAAFAGDEQPRSKSPFPSTNSGQESLRAPSDLYENAKPFRWAAQKRSDSVRVEIVARRWQAYAPPETTARSDTAEVWVMRGDAFGPVNPFLPGTKDPFVVRRVLPGGRLALRCQVNLVEAGAPDPAGAPRVRDFTLGREGVRLATPMRGSGTDLFLRTVSGRGRSAVAP